MNQQFPQIISILQLISVIAIIITLAIIIFKLIIYKKNSDKREVLIDGLSKYLIGVLILGSLGLIVSFLYGYLMDLGSNTLNASVASTNANIAKMVSNPTGDTGGFLGSMFGAFIKAIADCINSIFGLTSINQLVTPAKASIFTQQQWNVLEGIYGVLTIPAVALFAVMVFKTGISFLRSSLSPKEITAAKDNIFRWCIVIIVLAGGFLLCQIIVAFGNTLWNIFNETAKNVIPNLNFSKLSKDSSGTLYGGFVAFYFTWINLRVNVLFYIRDITLAVFIVFTPIAITLWGLDRNINAFSIWLGELLSNALMGFFLSVTFTVFSALLVSLPKHNASQFLFLLVGLPMTLRVASVLRNSVQGWMTRMSGINEDEFARRATIGGMLSGALGVSRDIQNAKRLGSEIKSTAQKLGNKVSKVPSKINEMPESFAAAKAGIDDIGSNIKDGFSSKAQVVSDSGKLFGGFSANSKNSNLNNIASQARKNLEENAQKNGQLINPDGVSGVGTDGLESINGTASKNAFLKNLEDSTNENPYSSTRDNIEEAKDKTISQIDSAIRNDPAYLASMPDFTQQAKDETDEFIRNNPDEEENRDDIQDKNLKAAQSQWIQAKAENEFANKVLGIGDVNRFDKDSNGFEHLSKPLNQGYKNNDSLATGLSHAEDNSNKTKPTLEEKNRRRMNNAITKLASQNQSSYDNIVSLANSEGQQVKPNYTMRKQFNSEVAKHGDKLTNYTPATSSGIRQNTAAGDPSLTPIGTDTISVNDNTNSNSDSTTPIASNSYNRSMSTTPVGTGTKSVSDTNSNSSSTTPISTNSYNAGSTPTTPVGSGTNLVSNTNSNSGSTTPISNSYNASSTSTSVGTGINSVSDTSYNSGSTSTTPVETEMNSASSNTYSNSTTPINTNSYSGSSTPTASVGSGINSVSDTNYNSSSTISVGSGVNSISNSSIPSGITSKNTTSNSGNPNSGAFTTPSTRNSKKITNSNSNKGASTPATFNKSGSNEKKIKIDKTTFRNKPQKK